MRFFRTHLIRPFVLLPLLLLLGSGAFAQDPLRSRMSLSAWQGDGETIRLSGLLRARIDRRYVGLPDLPVEFRMQDGEEEVSLGQAKTNDKGFANLELPVGSFVWKEDSTITVIAEFPGNNEYKGSDDDVDFRLLKVEMEGYEEDSSRYVRVRLTSMGEPVAEEDVKLFVKSMTLPLEIAEEETDEMGEAVFSFPTDLPGNADGTIDIRAFAEDTDDYGTLEYWLQTDWGVERILAAGKNRELWSPAPPLWLFLAFMGILAFIWGHYLYVIYELFKFRKGARTQH